jgi:glycosyltransferase involved in cell wall biosynthesis
MKDIYIFTNSYPYTKSVEVFIEEEINIASKMGCNIFIIPTNKDKVVRPIPENIKVLPCITECGILSKILTVMSMPFFSNFWRMLAGAGLSKRIVQGIKYFYGACLTRKYIVKTIKSPSILYSYWFSYSALGLAMARNCNDNLRNSTMISRGHGYDVFAEQRNIYIPNRKFTLSNLDSVFPVSDTGTSYLSKLYPEYATKITTRRLGIKPIKPSTNRNNGQLSFVSCSAMIKLKRVDLIFSMISKYAKNHGDRKFSWTHFGDGPAFDEISRMSKNAPQNLDIKLNGFTEIAEIRKNYSEIGFDIFVNLSTTEGIPVSIMEAISAGIPAIATNVGGNSEVVCDETGALVPADVEYKDFETAVDLIIKNHAKLRESAAEYFMAYYEAEKNYTDFYTHLQRM